MKKQLMIIALAGAVLPAFSQETNRVPDKTERQGRQERRSDFDAKRDGEGGQRFHEMSEEEKNQLQKKRIQLMEKTLEEIGVSEEQRAQILAMQEAHKAQMRAASETVEAARKKLHELEKADASQEQIFAAIDAVSDAQAEQMKILTRNRMEMERLLGKEKFHQFMEAARKQYKKHGRRGGQGMPPLPGREQDQENLPPTP